MSPETVFLKVSAYFYLITYEPNILKLVITIIYLLVAFYNCKCVIFRECCHYYIHPTITNKMEHIINRIYKEMQIFNNLFDKFVLPAKSRCRSCTQGSSSSPTPATNPSRGRSEQENARPTYPLVLQVNLKRKRSSSTFHLINILFLLPATSSLVWRYSWHRDMEQVRTKKIRK